MRTDDAIEARYNGWTNYETWVVKLWIDNDQPIYEYWREATRESFRDDDRDYASQTREDHARRSLMDALKRDFEENAPELEGVWADLFGAALSSVNWYEIASNMIEELDDDFRSECEAQS